MKLPDTPAWVIKEQEKSKRSEQITKAIDNQTEVICSQISEVTEINKKQLDNDPILFEQLEDFKNDMNKNSAESSRKATRAQIVAIAALLVAIASLVVTIIK